MRDLSTDTGAAALADTVYPVILAFFDFQSGPVRVWYGMGDLSWDSQTWTGLGTLGNISPIEESSDVRANGVAFSLTGVPSGLIATVLGDNYQGRTVKVWVGATNAAGQLYADPYQLFSGRMDRLEIDDGSETATIRVYAESRMVDLDRANERRYTQQDQQIDFPGDDFLQYMPTAQTTPFIWGGQKVAATATYGGGSRETEAE